MCNPESLARGREPNQPINEVEIYTDNFRKPGNIQGGFNYARLMRDQGRAGEARRFSRRLTAGSPKASTSPI
jgi:hypothetical protein